VGPRGYLPLSSPTKAPRSNYSCCSERDSKHLIQQPTPLPPFNNPTPEQAFLAKNYDENAKKPDRDPRGAFRNPADLTAAAAGIVGPLGSSSFNLPNVERALTEMEIGIGAGSTAVDSTRRSTRNPGATTGRPPPGLAPVGTASTSARSPASPAPITGSPSPTGGQTQHEVLQNFFQSLLSSKDRAGASVAATAASGGRAATPKANGNTSGGEDTSA
jgi:dynein light intermediate chain 1